MSRRNRFKPIKKTTPYAPLISFGFLALVLFTVFQLLESTLCKMVAIVVKNAPCAVALPDFVRYMLPLFFLLLGVIGTAWNAMRNRSFPRL